MVPYKPEEFLEPHPQPAVSEEEFAALETAYGVVLPGDMKAFYRKQNGGRMKSGKYYVLQDGLSLKAFHPIARTFADCYLTLNTLLEWQQRDEFLPNTLVPFCSDAGGDFYYIQADGKGEHVYYIFHEDVDAYLDNPESCLSADSFTDFLEKIHPAAGGTCAQT